MILMPLCYVVVRLERLPSHSAIILFSRSFFSSVYVAHTCSCQTRPSSQSCGLWRARIITARCTDYSAKHRCDKRQKHYNKR